MNNADLAGDAAGLDAALSDDELLELARAGDASAYGELWRRHANVGRAVALNIASASEADDLVSEAFARILTTMRRGGGPISGFRPYLLTTIRNVSRRWAEKPRDSTIDDLSEFEDPSTLDDPAIAALDRTLTLQAFRTLPERWQTVLWYSEVEGLSPNEIAPFLGMTANATAALAYRARAGLRTAWIQAHIDDESRPAECRWTVARLGQYVANSLTEREREKVNEHLDTCPKCSIIVAELGSIGSHLAFVLLPLLVGVTVGSTVLASLRDAASTSVADPPPVQQGSTTASVRKTHRTVAAVGLTLLGVAAAAAIAMTFQGPSPTEVPAAGPTATPTLPQAQAPQPTALPEPSPSLETPGSEADAATPATDVAPLPAAYLTASNGSVQCSSAPPAVGMVSAQAFSCTGNQFPATVPSVGSATANELLTATGTASFASANYRVQSCAPVQLGNAALTSDPMLVRGDVTFAQAGPVSGTGSLGLDGSTALAVDVTSVPGPQTFSIGIWFKSSTASGGLMGFSSSPSGADAVEYDRHLYFNAAGNIVFGVYPGTVQTIQSPANYADGVWHYAVGTLLSSGTTSTQTLYIDGVLVATTTGVVPTSGGAQQYDGYWRVGQAQTSTADLWTGTGQYFAGSLSGAAVFPTALTAPEVAGLYAATTKSALDTLIASAGATSYWPLSDTGLQTYAGPYPMPGATSPCAHIRVTVGTASTCVYPALAAACPAPDSSALLTGLTSAGALALVPPTLTLAQSVTTTVSRDSTYDSDYDAGLHLLVPIVVTLTGYPQTFTWASNTIVI